MTTTKPAASAKTLLIVEDDVLPAMALEGALTDAGYHVLNLTSSHQEALLAAGKCKPDLALVNIELQGRDDGIALALDLQGLGIPVLFISGQVSRARSAQTVAIASLPKPYDVADMVRAVDYLLSCGDGGEKRVPPSGLEIFGACPNGQLPEAA